MNKKKLTGFKIVFNHQTMNGKKKLISACVHPVLAREYKLRKKTHEISSKHPLILFYSLNQARNIARSWNKAGRKGNYEIYSCWYTPSDVVPCFILQVTQISRNYKLEELLSIMAKNITIIPSWPTGTIFAKDITLKEKVADII